MEFCNIDHIIDAIEEFTVTGRQFPFFSCIYWKRSKGTGFKFKNTKVYCYEYWYITIIKALFNNFQLIFVGSLKLVENVATIPSF